MSEFGILNSSKVRIFTSVTCFTHLSPPMSVKIPVLYKLSKFLLGNQWSVAALIFCHYIKYCNSKFLRNMQWHLQPVLSGYPFLVPAFHCLSLLCLFLDHFLLRGGQCSLYVSPLQQRIRKGASGGLYSIFALLPSESTPHSSRQVLERNRGAQSGSACCREGVGGRRIFPMNDSHITLRCCLQQEKF